MNKPTKIDMYYQILNHLTDADEIAFIQHEIELTVKKNASRSTKPTKAQVANATLADTVLNAMVDGHAYRVADIKGLVAELAEATPQKVSAIMTRLRKNGQVTRDIVKGVTYFTKVEE